MERQGTGVTAAVAAVVLLAVWWLAAEAAGRGAAGAIADTVVADAGAVADMLVERGEGTLRMDDEVLAALDAVAGASGVAVLRDETGRALAAGGGPAPAPPAVDVLADAAGTGLVHVASSEGQVRAVVPVARADGRTLVLDVQHASDAVRPAALRRESAWVAGAGAVLVAALVTALGRRRDRLLRTRVEGQRAAVRRVDALLTEQRDLDRAKDGFLTAASHAVRTPLQAIEGAARLLADRAPDLSPDQLARLSEGMATSARRLSGLMQDVLDLDRLVRGLGEARRRPVNLPELVDEVLTHHDPGDRTIEVEVATGEVLVDPAQVGRIVDHLVHNALRHSPPDGVVTVQAHHEDEDVHLAVLDQGPGVPGPLRLRVFEPLFRVDHDDADPGAGVGLALVRRFAELHGGRAWVEDAPGGGAAVHVVLPRSGHRVGVDAWGAAAALR